jgi:uracil DNA glycosylase
MGRKAESWQLLLPGQKILKCVHPAAAQYKGGKWISDKIFERINKELKKQKKSCINW